MGIEDDYLAFCFDETVLYLTAKVTDKQGKTNWSKIKWKDSPKRANNEFIEFVKKQSN